MKPRHLWDSSALLFIAMSMSASADTIYSSLKDIPIPTNLTGVYLDVDGSNGWNNSDTSPVSGWDINPFYGGVAVANSPTFQPARIGTGGNLASIVNFAVGNSITGSISSTLSGAFYSSDFGGSSTHLAASSGDNKFIASADASTEGYIGFKLNQGTYETPVWAYGWMRVIFNGNGSQAAVIKDWAYDNSGAAIVVGRVLESVTDTTHHLVTLSPQGSETFTLSSALANNGSGVTNSVLKTGTGTTTLAGTNTYSGATTVSNGKLLVNGSITGSGAVSVANAAILGGTGSIAGATTISAGGIHTAGDVVTGTNPSGAGTIGKGIFTTGVTYNQGSIFEWNLTANTSTTTGTRGTDYDAVNTAALATTETGAIFRVVLNGSQNFSETFWQQSRHWDDIFTNVDGTTNWNIASIFSSVQTYNSGSSVTPTGGSFSMSGTSLTWTAVPEPTTALAGILLGTGLLRRRRH